MRGATLVFTQRIVNAEEVHENDRALGLFPEVTV